MIVDRGDRLSDDGSHICPMHGPYRSVVLATGIYTFCEACVDEEIEAAMVAIRVELADKGYPGYEGYRSEASA